MAPFYQYGCHLKKHGSYIHAAKEALRLREAEGLSCIQLFGKNPRSLEQKSWSQKDAAACKSLLDAAGIKRYTHSAYPLNLAVHIQDQPELFQKTATSLLQELMIADALGARGVVVHFGVIKHGNKLKGYQDIIAMLNTVTQVWTGHALILLENQAGMHGGLGTTIEEMVQIRNLCEHPGKIGFCLDTCHAFVSGLWQANDKAGTSELLFAGEKLGYWEHLKLVHLNDTFEAFGSKRDRHARLGTGVIPKGAFQQFLSSSVLRDKPFILETEPIGMNLHTEEWAIIREM